MLNLDENITAYRRCVRLGPNGAMLALSPAYTLVMNWAEEFKCLNS